MKGTDTRKPYGGQQRSLVIALDVGTTFSGVSYAILEPREVPKIHGVTMFPGQAHVSGNSKIPSIIYYDKSGSMRAAGAEAESSSVAAQAELEGWSRVELFKLRLRPKTMKLDMNGMKLSPLPLSKNATDVFGDFLGYLFRCTKDFFVETHANGHALWNSWANDIQFVLSHPNGWEGAQQTKMRRAAIHGGLIPDSDDGKARIRFVTEGESSLHACILNGLAADVLSSPSEYGFIIADAGGGTLDVSTYAIRGTSPLVIEEIAPPDCVFSGSEFVSRRAKAFLQDKLKDSKWGTPESIDFITKKFDESTKRMFQDRNAVQFVQFGTPLDRDASVGIKVGRLSLTGEEVADFFEPSVTAAVESIQNQIRSASGAVRSVWLVGGFAASPYLFQQLQERLAPLGVTVSRPDSQTSKAVADGAIGFYCDHHVSARVSKYMYGVEFLREYDPTQEDHVARRNKLTELPSGPKLLPDAFDCILARGVKVKESKVFSRKYCTELTSLTTLSVFEVEVWCYRGGDDIPQWILRRAENFSTLCIVRADLSPLSASAEAKPGRNGKTYWTVVFSVEIHFGLTEFRARIKWIDKGQTRYGPASVIYNEMGTKLEDEDGEVITETRVQAPVADAYTSTRTKGMSPYGSLSKSGSSSASIRDPYPDYNKPASSRNGDYDKDRSSKSYAPSYSSRDDRRPSSSRQDGDRESSSVLEKSKNRDSTYSSSYPEPLARTTSGNSNIKPAFNDTWGSNSQREVTFDTNTYPAEQSVPSTIPKSFAANDITAPVIEVVEPEPATTKKDKKKKGVAAATSSPPLVTISEDIAAPLEVNADAFAVTSKSKSPTGSGTATPTSAKAKKEADKRAKEEAEKLAKQEKEAAEAAKLEADRVAKELADAQKKADEDAAAAKAKKEADEKAKRAEEAAAAEQRRADAAAAKEKAAEEKRQAEEKKKAEAEEKKRLAEEKEAEEKKKAEEKERIKKEKEEKKKRDKEESDRLEAERLKKIEDDKAAEEEKKRLAKEEKDRKKKEKEDKKRAEEEEAARKEEEEIKRLDDEIKQEEEERKKKEEETAAAAAAKKLEEDQRAEQEEKDKANQNDVLSFGDDNWGYGGPSTMFGNSGSKSTFGSFGPTSVFGKKANNTSTFISASWGNPELDDDSKTKSKKSAAAIAGDSFFSSLGDFDSNDKNGFDFNFSSVPLDGGASGNTYGEGEEGLRSANHADESQYVPQESTGGPLATNEGDMGEPIASLDTSTPVLDLGATPNPEGGEEQEEEYDWGLPAKASKKDKKKKKKDKGEAEPSTPTPAADVVEPPAGEGEEDMKDMMDDLLGDTLGEKPEEEDDWMKSTTPAASSKKKKNKNKKK